MESAKGEAETGLFSGAAVKKEGGREMAPP